MIYRLTILSTLILLLFSGLLHGQEAIKEYIAKYKPIADSLWLIHGIPSSVMLGIAIVESGGGTSILSRKFHNHFGFKGRNQNAHSKLGKHSSYKEYASDYASYLHFVKVVERKKFYPKLKGNPNSKLWIASLKNTGYAVNKKWVAQVNQTIDKFKLDNPVSYSRKNIVKIKPLPVPPFGKYRTTRRPFWY
jgi:flagellum-specific peptidoglycan hydrolase FlgJ